MSEVEKLSPAGTESENVDVQKVVRQQLESLHLAGLTHLPKGTGEYSFDWTPTPAAEVKESNPAFQGATASGAAASGASESVNPGLGATAINSQPQTDAAASGSALPACTQVRQLETTSSASAHDPYGPSLGLAERKSALNVLQDEVAGCTRCTELSEHRTQTVFGVGDPTSRLVFVGEGPGADEDRLGEPFVGEAGKLLDKIIGACKISRSDVYILNTVKCRPPANRNPSQDELSNCWGYAQQQLEIIQPEFICCLGSVAARTLLKTTQSLGRLRKQFHSYRGSRVLVTYHPAYLLRTPSAKRHVWEDMKMLMKEMGVELSN